MLTLVLNKGDRVGLVIFVTMSSTLKLLTLTESMKEEVKKKDVFIKSCSGLRQ